MFEAPSEWSSFWDLMTPEDAAANFRETYGPAAAAAAAECAEAAKNDNRATDHAFWVAVSTVLGAPASPTGATLLRH